MPLDDTTRALDRTAAVSEAVAEVGRTIRATLPRKATEKDKLFADFWGWSLVLRMVEPLRDKSKRAAVAGEVLPDHAAHPFAVGTSETVYSSELGSIGMKVVEQADRLDVPGFVADLEKAGVKPALLKRLQKKHNRSFPGAHIFTASLTG
jgi:hypothetical protein